MKFKPTFFSITGFLVPGAVALIACYLLIPAPHLQWMHNLAVPQHDAGSTHTSGEIVSGTLVLASVLIVAFLIGSILSEVFLATVRFGFRKRFTHDKIHAQAAKLLNKKNLVDLLKGDLDAREAFAYIHTSGLDLHWFAGRIRMIGGSSVALAATACAAWSLKGIPSHYLLAAAIALIGIAVALYRTYRFDQYINMVAATCYFEAISLPKQNQQPTGPPSEGIRSGGDED